MPNDISRYVFNGVEVVLTGRSAEKQLRRKVDTVYEIKPANPEFGSWMKWVRMEELYKIRVGGHDENNPSTK